MEIVCKAYNPRLLEDPRHTLEIHDFLTYQSLERYDTVYGDIWPDMDDYANERIWIEWKQLAVQFLKPNGIILGWHKSCLKEIK